MLKLIDNRFEHNCQGYSRRAFLKVGALGFGGLTLSGLLAAQATARSLVRDRAVVLLFLQGGPPQIETFDPKMSAPAEIRSITGEVSTTLPGITFGGTFPQLAKLADRLAVVRSYGSGNSQHELPHEVLSAGNPTKGTAGAVYSRIAGTNHPRTGLPSHTLVLPEAVSPGLVLARNFETEVLHTLTASGDLGPSYTAFNPIGGGDLKQDMELTLPRDRFEDRRQLLKQLDRLRRQADTTDLQKRFDKYQQQAYDVIIGGAADAFDLSQEDSRTLRRYDTSQLFRNEEAQKVHKDMKRATNLLGRQMLLARRLCEAGCGFVTVCDGGWDIHNHGHVRMNWLGPQVDHAVAAFVTDLAERGLADKILLIVTGEMGRSPRLGGTGGRDHHGKLTPLLLAGGGWKMGQVIGRSDSHAAEPAIEAFGPAHLFCTIMHTLFDLGELRVTPGVPTDLIRFLEKTLPISGL